MEGIKKQIEDWEGKGKTKKDYEGRERRNLKDCGFV